MISWVKHPSGGQHVLRLGKVLDRTDGWAVYDGAGEELGVEDNLREAKRRLEQHARRVFALHELPSPKVGEITTDEPPAETIRKLRADVARLEEEAALTKTCKRVSPSEIIAAKEAKIVSSTEARQMLGLD